MATTAEMDGWLGNPNDPKQWHTHYQCLDCGEWTLFKSTKELSGHRPRNGKCETCGGKRFNSRSAISRRTFDSEKALKLTKRIIKENERKGIIR